MKRIIYIPFDHLHRKFGALKDADPNQNVIAFVESARMTTGETACPFTTLYWDFLDRHKETFAKNHRMSQQIFGLKRLSDLPELKERAQEVLEGLQKGKI